MPSLPGHGFRRWVTVDRNDGCGLCIDFPGSRGGRLTHSRDGRRRCSDCRAPALAPLGRRCFAVFSLLIILLDLVRRGVVHCTRLRTPRPALPIARDVCRCHTRLTWNLTVAYLGFDTTLEVIRLEGPNYSSLPN